MCRRNNGGSRSGRRWYGPAGSIKLIVGALLVAALVSGTDAGASARTTPTLSEEFAGAGAEHGVPQELLKAMGYVNTRWEMPPPEASEYEKSKPGLGTPDARGTYGIMALTQNPYSDSLGQASRLTRTPREVLKENRASNINGGAAVLRRIAGAEEPEDLAGWYDAVAEYGGGPLYADQVFETLREGASARTTTGELVTLRAHSDVQPPQRRAASAAGEYPGSTMYPAHPDNYAVSSRESTYDIDKVIIHVAQGSYAGTLEHFQKPRLYASAHYTVRSDDGAVGQSVREKDVGYHAGNLPYNQTSIGIEHEGLVSEPNKWFTDAMYRSSARLTAYLCQKYNIPIDRAHIIGHNEVPDPDDPGWYGGIDNHTDPGSGWNWTKYMEYVRSYSGTAPAPAPAPTPTYSQTVDNVTPGRFSAGGNWRASSYGATGNYGTTHRYLNPGATFAPAQFKINVPARDAYDVYGWWPSSSGYNDRVRFRIRTASGWVAKDVSQRTNGGRWVLLGRHTLSAGDAYWVQVSNLSRGQGYINADAVRIVRR